MKSAWIALVFCCVLAPVAKGIITADNSTAETNPVSLTGFNWDYVYNYKNSSAVAVGEYWILTAAHVADDINSTIPNYSNVVVNGTVYYPQQIIFHAAADDPQHSQKADLALVRFDKPFPGSYSLYTGSFPTHPGEGPDNRLDAVMVGFGRIGTVYSNYFNEIASGNGTKRWGSQKIDEATTGNYNAGGTTGVTYNDGVSMMFKLTDSTYEAGVGVYDSGGGSFVDDGGTWKLAGINTVRYGTAPNYTGTFAVSMPDYATWITQTMDAVTGDADADGIPNWWEDQYSTNVLVDTDQDGDGVSGGDEYIADTDPTDSLSFAQAEVAFTGTNLTFTFYGSTARQYQLLTTTNSLTAIDLTWMTNGLPIWGEGAVTQIIATNIEKTVYYSVEAVLP